MEKKVYYSERNVDINELVKNLSGVERLSLAFLPTRKQKLRMSGWCWTRKITLL